MTEKIFEFKDLKELANSEIFNNKDIKSIKTHYDKTNKKYITKVNYEKK